MNCREIQEYCVACAGEELPVDMQRHIEACRECREAYEAALTVAKLISLKRFETPDPGFEARSLARIRTSLYALEDERSHGWRIWNLFDRNLVPVMRYAMAAVVLLLGGLYMVSVSGLPSLQSPTIVEPAPAVSHASFASEKKAGFMQDSNAFNPSLLVASNDRPGRVQYGPGPSVPVSFQY